LTLQKRQRIGRWKEKFPNASYHEVANEFNCTYEQARRAALDYKAGKLHRTKSRQKPADVAAIMNTQDMDALLEKQYHLALAQLEADKKISVEERVKLLDDLFSMRKTLQQLKLESFIKRADAGVIKIIVKMFKPDATDDEVIKIYLEATETWKIQNK